MQRFKHTLAVVAITFLIISLLPGNVWSQSGRGRPRVPSREPAKPPPPPPKVPAASALVKQEQSGTTSRFLLRNGMSVIISEQHAAPIAAVVAYVKAGQVDEPEGVSGLAGVLARVVMRGMPAAKLRDIGALSGAEATAEGTAYYLVVAPGRIKEALAIQADMLKNPSLAADNLSREASLLAEERDDRDAMAITAGRAARLALAGSRFGRAFGSGESPVPVTGDQIAEFYRTAYRPEKLIISVAGDVSTFDTLIQIQQLYGDFGQAAEQPAPANPPETAAKPKPTPTPQATDKTANKATSKPAAPATQAPAEQPGGEQEPSRLRYAAERGDVSQSIITVAFRVPGLSSKERTALEMIAAIAGQGRGSRLHRSLVEGQPVANRVNADYLAVSGEGLLIVQARTDAGLIDKAGSGLFRELDRLRRELVSEGEMARARTLLEKRFIDEIGTYKGRALWLARAEATSGSLRTALDYRKALSGVSAEDVQRAAAKYFELANASVYEYEPLDAPARTFDAERFAATINAWAPEFGKPVDAKQVRPPESQSDLPVLEQGAERSPEQQIMFESVQPLAVKDFSTLNGPRAFVREDHSSPNVTVALLFQGGRVAEDDTNAGITELMLRSMLHGTPRRFSARVAQDLEQLGAEIEVVSEPDFFGLMISTLSRNADRAIAIAQDLIEEPAFRDDDIDRARAVQIGLIREARDSRSVRARALLLQALYPGHPYAIPSHGREEVVAKLTGDQLRDWHNRTVKRQLPLAIIVGDTSGSALVSGQLAEAFRRRELDETLKLKVAQAAAPAQKAEQGRNRGTALCVGFAAPKADKSSPVVAFELIEVAMNGPNGRLTAELVNKQKLASTARLEIEPLLTGGVIYAYVVCAPENGQRARAAVLAELERFARAGLSAEEIEDARTLAATMRVASLQSQTARALEYARAVFHGRDAASVDSFAEELSKLTPEEIKRVAASYFKPSSASTGILRGTR